MRFFFITIFLLSCYSENKDGFKVSIPEKWNIYSPDDMISLVQQKVPENKEAVESLIKKNNILFFLYRGEITETVFSGFTANIAISELSGESYRSETVASLISQVSSKYSNGFQTLDYDTLMKINDKSASKFTIKTVSPYSKNNIADSIWVSAVVVESDSIGKFYMLNSTSLINDTIINEIGDIVESFQIH